jgi:hypothetical protein
LATGNRLGYIFGILADPVLTVGNVELTEVHRPIPLFPELLHHPLLKLVPLVIAVISGSDR